MEQEARDKQRTLSWESNLDLRTCSCIVCQSADLKAIDSDKENFSLFSVKYLQILKRRYIYLTSKTYYVLRECIFIELHFYYTHKKTFYVKIFGQNTNVFCFTAMTNIKHTNIQNK